MKTEYLGIRITEDLKKQYEELAEKQSKEKNRNVTISDVVVDALVAQIKKNQEGYNPVTETKRKKEKAV